jgi:AcrR family transcriptional regulator
MFLMTGGRIGDRLFSEILSRVAERRLRRTEQAPEDPGEFFAFHFDAMREDSAWLTYLQREALTYGSGPIPHESDRLPVIQTQVEEIRRRQQAGLIDPRLNPRLVRLLGFALASYPRLLPQITRMTTGKAPEHEEFVAEWRPFLRHLGALLNANDKER